MTQLASHRHGERRSGSADLHRPAPLVTVAIASFNSAAYLEATVRSALAQTLPDIEVLIVDDASWDSSWEVAQRLCRADPRVRAERLARNGGPAAARNRAVALARGKWIAVLDSDDLFDADRLRRLLLDAEANEADLVADDLVLFGGKEPGGQKRFLGGGFSGPEWISLQNYLARTATWGTGADLGFLKPIIRTEALRRLTGPYDERLRIGEDDDLIVRLLLRGARYRLVPVPTYFYRKHADSITHRMKEAHLLAMIASSQRQLATIRRIAPECRAACERRLRVRRRALHFERMIGSLKARDWRAAISAIFAVPTPLPLLRLPVAARIERFWNALRNRFRHSKHRQQAETCVGPQAVFEGNASAANGLALLWFLEEVWPEVLRSIPEAELVVAGTAGRLPQIRGAVNVSGADRRQLKGGVLVLPEVIWIPPHPLAVDVPEGSDVVATCKANLSLRVPPHRISIADEPGAFAAALVRRLQRGSGGIRRESGDAERLFRREEADA